MKYTILFTKMLFISCLVLAMGISMAGCSDDEDGLRSGYGYAQFKLYKSASYNGGATGTTRAGVNELDYLRDAQKMKVVLINNADGSEIIQSVGLGATNNTDAEFGLRSDKLELLAGEYTVVGYYLYKIVGQELEQILSAEPEQTTIIKVVDGGLAVQDLTIKVVKRGNVTFTLEKDISTRGVGDGAYLFTDIMYAEVTVRNLFLNELTTFKELPVVYKEKVEKVETIAGAEKISYKCAVSVSDSVLSLKAGTYQIVSYKTFDRSKKSIEINMSQVGDNSFTVEDNKTTEAFVPIYLNETAPKLKDYLALKAIWEALDGKHWYYSGQNFPQGCNWNFDKEMDMWGEQPGVELDSQGRVIALSIGAFGPKGAVPAALGDLSELKVLTLGSHGDMFGDNVFEKMSNVSEAQIQSLRSDYYDKFVKQDVRNSFSEPLQKAFEMKDNTYKPSIIKTRAGISTRDVSTGNYTNGLTSIPDEIGNLGKLQQLYIANGYITELPATLSQLKVCTDLEVYNCPKMVKFPDAITTIPNLQLLNMASNPQIPSDEMFRGMTKFADGASKKDIQIIYIGINSLKELPANFKNLTKLGKLECSYNQIEKIHPFGKSINLVQLTMDHNKISEIPVAEDGFFCGFDDVETFSFSFNKLTKFPNIFNAKSVYVIGSVNFSNNQITEIEGASDGTFKGVNASSVILGNNKLTTFPKALIETGSPIGALNLSGNGMTDFPDGSLKGPKVHLLESLDLTYNKISKLPKEFSAESIPYLYGLDMSNNRFKKFPLEPLNISRLTVLGLRNQRDEFGNRTISDWPTGIYTCVGLRALYLAGNDFRKIDDTISYLIYVFEIKDNPNISIDMSAICPYIKANMYQLIYDRTQDIRGCSFLDLEK